MKKALSSTILILSIILPGFSPAQGAEPLVVFLVRHAEKDTDKKWKGKDKSRPLTEAGQERARILAEIFSSPNIDIYITRDYVRTKKTAEPTAEEFDLDLNFYVRDKPEELIDTLRRSGGRNLVVAHSGTLPELVALLGGIPGPGKIDVDNEFDRLYVVTIESDGKTCSEMQRYGKRYNPEQNVVRIKSIGKTCYEMERYGET